MIARRKKAFFRLVGLLREIEADLDNLVAVKALNLELLQEIIRDEQHIARHKARIGELKRCLKADRPSKEGAAVLRAEIRRVNGYVERYQDQIYIWKSIGDGLAYAYISSFNIKHAFFETDSTDVKPTAGAISGKDGLRHELFWLQSALDAGVPAVLCDITNVIRYGDFCLLGADDPFPIEVKSQKWLNKRGLRQKAKMATLHEFLKNDFAEGFRGVSEVRRVTMSSPFRDCVDTMNVCVENAMKEGHCMLCPERGLTYVAMIDGAVGETLGALSLKLHLFSHLNTDKTEKTWAPYTSFVNSIRDIDALYAFVKGDLSIFVCLDAAYLCEQIVVPGWAVSMVDDHDIAIVITEKGGQGRVAVSRQMLGRLFHEFASLEWFTGHEKDAISDLIGKLKAQVPVVFDESYANLTDNLDRMPKFVERG